MAMAAVLSAAAVGQAGLAAATDSGSLPAVVAAAATDPIADVHYYGSAAFFGDTRDLDLGAPIVGIAPTISGNGYWLAAEDGGVFGFGDAVFHGSMGAVSLTEPIVGIAAAPDGGGYWLVASDGGVFGFGTAGFYGSMGAVALNQPVVGMAAHPSGGGYWLVASDGGLFSFGASIFQGSMGGIPLNLAVVGMAASPSGGGYWLVASDGGIFAFGDAPFYGSTGALTLNQPVVGMATNSSGSGYWLVASDGGLFRFGALGFHGSALVAARLESVAGMAAAPDGLGYWIVRAAGPVSPLTGFPVSSIADRPALAVKVDNHSLARGQWGLNQTDMVVEELVEGSLSRFIAIFHSQGSGVVGPVRSARESDVEILPALGQSLLVYSGGNSTVRSIVAAQPAVYGIEPFGQFGGAYYRTLQRTAPHNLLSGTSTLWTFAPADFEAPLRQFQYSPDGQPRLIPASPTGTVTIQFGAVTAVWAWNGSQFQRSHGTKVHNDAYGSRIVADNVVVLETPYATSGSTGSPIALVVGGGTAHVFVRGQRIDGTWSRSSIHGKWVVRDGGGVEIELTPGRTWVELAPPGSIVLGS